MAKHARLGPSGAYIWTECTASPLESDGKPNDGNDASRMGTSCHEVVAECLQQNLPATDYFGRAFCFGERGNERIECFLEQWPFADASPDHVVVIDGDMVDYCTSYVAFVRDLVASTGATMLVEQRVPIEHITGEGYWADEKGREVPAGTPGAVWKPAGGTSDVILMYGTTLHIVDAKFGRGRVTAYDIVRPSIPDPITGEPLPPIYAPNKQMAMYAAGALHEHGLFGDFDTVKMTIVQPPLNNVSEYAMSVAELEDVVDWLRDRATETRTNPQFKAGDHCTFCKGREGCAARDKWVIETALTGFEDCTDPAQVARAVPAYPEATLLGVYYEKLDTIERWVGDIKSRVFQALKRGERVIGGKGEPYKLVTGKRGARSWTDANAVEELLRDRMRLRKDEMYQFKLLSPTQVEDALVKVPKAKKGEAKKVPVLGERQWTTLQEYITQPDGSPSIAPDSDPRPALAAATSGFEDEQVSQPPAAEPVDLFN